MLSPLFYELKYFCAEPFGIDMTLNYFNLLAYSLWKYITPFSILRP